MNETEALSYLAEIIDGARAGGAPREYIQALQMAREATNDDVISRSALIAGRVSNDPVVIAATCEPAVDPIHAAGGCYCRECVNYYEYDDWDRCHQETYTAHECSVFNRDLGPDGFCSRGELKKEVEE